MRSSSSKSLTVSRVYLGQLFSSKNCLNLEKTPMLSEVASMLERLRSSPMVSYLNWPVMVIESSFSESRLLRRVLDLGFLERELLAIDSIDCPPRLVRSLMWKKLGGLERRGRFGS